MINYNCELLNRYVYTIVVENKHKDCLKFAGLKEYGYEEKMCVKVAAKDYFFPKTWNSDINLNGNVASY